MYGRFFFVGFTVHFWGPAYVWFMFLLGSGVWLLDAGSSETFNRGPIRVKKERTRKCPCEFARRAPQKSRRISLAGVGRAKSVALEMNSRDPLEREMPAAGGV